LDRSLGGAAPVFHFYNCLFRTNAAISDPNYYTGCVSNSDPEFTDPAIWDFHIGSGGAENIGTYILADDLDGVSRSDPSDVGCYER
jgi:hypothetical protein